MSDLLMPGLGASYWISTTPPTDQLLATYQALTWVKVGNLEDIPEYGPQHSVVTFTELETGIVRKYHGELNYGSITLPVGYDEDDPGQVDLISALDDKTRVAFRSQFSDGTADFYQGKVFSATKMKNIGSVVMRNVNVEIETAIVTGAAVPPPPPPPP